ncbi:MAG: chemotaxis protein [Gammaproteobacteria bacterium]|nr:chemotaxis protein [Gammaproteobacteria bacterium]
MTSVLSSVDQRTNLVGQNRLELLLFRLQGPQFFGINVFKVREVLPCPALNVLPGSHGHVRGVAHVRGEPITVIDLSAATGGKPVADLKTAFILVTEYNRHVQAFLVGNVERIVNVNWSDMLPPPDGVGRSHYMTAVTRIENRMVQVIDVEKVFSEISPMPEEISESIKHAVQQIDLKDVTVLVADDSAVARNQVRRALESMGVKVELVNDGRQALDWLLDKAEQVDHLSTVVPLLISDIEMPEMDGYTLTAEIKQNDKLKAIHIILHSSLSGVFNEVMIKKVGADQFIAKFHPDELASAVQRWLNPVVD